MPRLFLICLLGALLTSCGTTAKGAHPRIVHLRSTLNWSVVSIQDVPTLDPALALDATSISVASLLYGGLVRLDSHLRVRADGASRWTISRDGKVYTFTLRKDLRFADGRRVTAQDFIRALGRALGADGAFGAASAYLDSIARLSVSGQGGTVAGRAITAVNERTVRITLQHPSAHFLAELAFPASYVPDPRVIARYGAAWTDHASGFGPFRVRVWSHTRLLSLVPNPYYWRGKVAFKEIKLRFLSSKQAVNKYRQDTVDIVSGMQPGHRFSGAVAGVRRVPGLALDYLAFNTARLPFFRINARRAFASAWDPQLASKALASAGFPARSTLPSAFGIPSPEWRPTRTGASYLVRARYPKGKGFPPITLVMQRDSQIFTMANLLTRAWGKRLGVHIAVRQLNASNYSKVLASHSFDLALVRWGGDYSDPQDFLGTQLGSSPDNITGWSTKQYVSAVHLADSYNPDDVRRVALFRSAAAIVSAKVPILPLDEPALTAIIRPQLTGVDLTPLGTITGDWVHARLLASAQS
ncbi:MAG: ABC transporter substrate-binding protein [Chloroflexota bacterium]